MWFYPETLLNGMARILEDGRTSESVAVNSYENDKAYMVIIPVPGVKSENINVESENGLLNVSCKTEEEKSKDIRWIRRERANINFKQSLRLPEDADAGKISAKIEDGLLHIAISKKESSVPKKITVKVS